METIKIQSVEANIPQVEAYLESVCSDFNCYNYFGTISVAVLQAVENAIVHGNKCNPDKTVTIKYSRAKGGLAFVVEDEGNGFDYTQYTDLPTDSVSIDTLVYLDANRTAKLTFHIGYQLFADSAMAAANSAVIASDSTLLDYQDSLSLLSPRQAIMPT